MTLVKKSVLQKQNPFLSYEIFFSAPGFTDHMTLSDFRCHFQALSPPIMKRYASMFVSHDERKVGHMTSHTPKYGAVNVWVSKG